MLHSVSNIYNKKVVENLGIQQKRCIFVAFNEDKEAMKWNELRKIAESRGGNSKGVAQTTTGPKMIFCSSDGTVKRRSKMAPFTKSKSR
jgi:hypothetical protein